jgi:hypothetical protein
MTLRWRLLVQVLIPGNFVPWNVLDFACRVYITANMYLLIYISYILEESK